MERKEAEKAREQRDLHKRGINNQEPREEEVEMGTHLGGLLLGSKRATQPEGAPPFDTFFLTFSLLSGSVNYTKAAATSDIRDSQGLHRTCE